MRKYDKWQNKNNEYEEMPKNKGKNPFVARNDLNHFVRLHCEEYKETG